LNLKGYSLRDLERWDEYVTIQTKLLKINPLDEDAWRVKGMALFELSKYDEVIFCYDKVLEINPDDAENWFSKGEALEKLSKYSESISCYEKGFEINPEDPDISDWSSGDGTAMQSLDAVKAKLSNDSSSETAEKIEVIEKSEPLDVLKMRLAKGEITLEEFNEIKEHLV
jgi:tetratricopeptide (TPR) repeat protein